MKPKSRSSFSNRRALLPILSASALCLTGFSGATTGPRIPLRKTSTRNGGSLEPATTPDAATLVAHYDLDPAIADEVSSDLVLRARLGFSTDTQLAIDLRTGIQTRADDVPEIALTPAEAEEFFTRQSLGSDAQVIYDALTTERFADSFAGMYIDQLGGGKLVVESTPGGADAIRSAVEGDLSKGLLHSDRLVFQTVGYSRRQLLTSREIAVQHFADEVDKWARRIYVDDAKNELVVEIPSGAPSEMLRVDADYFDKLGVPYRFVVQPAFQPADGTYYTDSTVPPYSGGHGYSSSNSTQAHPPATSVFQHEECTLGFSVHRSDDPNHYYMLSASHCWSDLPGPAPIDSKAYYNLNSQNGGTRIVAGVLKGYQITESRDLSLIGMTDTVIPKIVVNVNTNPDHYRFITSSPSYEPQGLVISQVGASRNGVGNGTIVDWGSAGSYTVADMPGVVHGDSGGPVYVISPDINGHLAAGAIGTSTAISGNTLLVMNASRELHGFCGTCDIAIAS